MKTVFNFMCGICLVCLVTAFYSGDDEWPMWPDPKDCTKYFMQDPQTAQVYHRKCPEELHYNAETRMCDFPVNAGCAPGSGRAYSSSLSCKRYDGTFGTFRVCLDGYGNCVAATACL